MKDLNEVAPPHRRSIASLDTDKDTTSRVAQQAIYDGNVMTRRFIEEPTLTRAVGFSQHRIDGVRYGVIDVAELMLFIAGTASLIEYRLADGEWRLDAITEGSSQAQELLNALDNLRVALVRRQSEAIELLSGGRSARYSKRSLAILYLALDATHSSFEIFALNAGIELGSNDPVGDAQLLAEQWDVSNGRDPLITPLYRA